MVAPGVTEKPLRDGTDHPGGPSLTGQALLSTVFLLGFYVLPLGVVAVLVAISAGADGERHVIQGGIDGRLAAQQFPNSGPHPFRTGLFPSKVAGWHTMSAGAARSGS